VSERAKKTLAVRVDGGKVWGTSLGHIKRQILLARELKNSYEPVFIMKNFPDGVDFVKSHDIAVKVIGRDDNSDTRLCAICEEIGASKLIVDLRGCPYESVFVRARSLGMTSVVFDIDGSFRGEADFLINDSFVSEFTAYRGLSSRTTKLTGPEYFIMEAGIIPAQPSGSVTNVMITMGGSDPAGLTAAILRHARERVCGFNLAVVLGPLFTGHKEIRSLAADFDSITVYDNPAEFLLLMNRQDVVITAGGRTLYECAFLGKVVITVPSIEHEAITAREYAALTGAFDTGMWTDSGSPARIKNALDLYSGDSTLCNAIREKSRRLVDGKGLSRLAHVLA
jgi:spore coat polysaccharide biosynthesis predicted glycosyltransferase SpsG